MKKHIIMIALLSVLTVSTGCGAEEAEQSSQQGKAPAYSASSESSAETATETKTSSEAQEASAETSSQAGTSSQNAGSSGNTEQKTQEQAAPTLDQGDYLFGGFVATQGDDLNLRKAPDKGSEVIAKIPNSTQIDVYSCDVSGWYLTSFNDKVGYVSSDYIDQVPAYDGYNWGLGDANAYGFYSIDEPPASSISVASLSGTWTNADDTAQTLDIAAGGDFYSGSFTLSDGTGVINSGYVRFEYALEPDGSPSFWYTFYDNSGALWEAFGASGEVPLNDIYAGQSGFPHFTRN